MTIGKGAMNNLSVTREVSARIPTRHGEFQLTLYRSGDCKEHLAMTLGGVQDRPAVLTRLHSECLTGDVLGSVRCDCGEQLERSLHMIGRAGSGVLLYLRQEGRGIGLRDKLRAYNLQDEGLDTVEANLRLGRQADERDYGVAARILVDLGVQSVNLITNNPSKIEGLRQLGIPVVGRTPIQVAAHPENTGLPADEAAPDESSIGNSRRPAPFWRETLMHKGVDMKPNTRRYLIIALALTTAALHFGAALDRRIFPDGPDPLFTLNGLGYLGLLLAYYLPLDFLRSSRGLIRRVFVIYALVTIAAWAIIYVGLFVIRDGHAFFSVDAIYGIPAKIVELALVYCLRQDKS